MLSVVGRVLKVWSDFSWSFVLLCTVFRGVVLPERGGTPFRQIFLSRNGVPVNIVYHSRNADTAANQLVL